MMDPMIRKELAGGISCGMIQRIRWGYIILDDTKNSLGVSYGMVQIIRWGYIRWDDTPQTTDGGWTFNLNYHDKWTYWWKYLGRWLKDHIGLLWNKWSWLLIDENITCWWLKDHIRLLLGGLMYRCTCHSYNTGPVMKV